jgi:eukaryotic-like serine/threonine-protein kinase
MVAMGTRWRRLGGDPTAFLEHVQRRYPDDFWVNFELGHLLGGHDLRSAIGYSRAALAVRPDAAAAHYNIGTYLSQVGRREQAIHHYRRAIEINPHHTWAQTSLAACLQSEGRLGESVEHFREASALDPSSVELRQAVRSGLLQQGRHEEARVDWRRWLNTDPAAAEEWDGYAELCLFLEDEAEYRRACGELLERFGDSDDPHTCERIGRACLLLPPDTEHLRIAEAMIDRALAADPSQYEKWAYPYFLFAKALAEYRRDRFDPAIVLLEGEASGVLEPAPALVLAMAQHRRGQPEEARRTLASAIDAYDWQVASANTREAWMWHALRREAESMITGGSGSVLDRPSEAK